MRETAGGEVIWSHAAEEVDGGDVEELAAGAEEEDAHF